MCSPLGFLLSNVFIGAYEENVLVSIRVEDHFYKESMSVKSSTSSKNVEISSRFLTI